MVCVPGGDEYLLPVSHSPSLLRTSEELLAEAGITHDDLDSFDGFIDACTHFHDVFPESNVFVDLGPYDLDSLNLQYLWDFSGFHPIDYENNAVAMNEDSFRRALDLCRLYSGNDPNQDPYPNSDYALAGCILNRDCLFSYFGNTPLLMKDTQALIRKGGETALFLTPPDIDGGKSTLINSFGAIPTMSPNKLNAWRMLKILLSYDVQSNPDALKAVYPVRKDAVSPFLRYSYVRLSEEEFDVRISTELSAGKGPDLLFCLSRDTPDPYRTMTVRLFEDLDPYFENDAGFGFENYLGEVMNCGVLNGERQLVPVEIQIPLYQTSLEAVSETVMPDAVRRYQEYLSEAGEEEPSGIIQTFEDFCSACIRYHEENPDGMLFPAGENGDDLRALLSASGMQFIDYERGLVTVREEELHTILDVCRAFRSANGQTVGADEKQTDGTKKNAFLSPADSDPAAVLSELQDTRRKGETPCLFPLYDVDGGITAEVLSYAAILRSSQNKLNAYRLLCILLSEEIQSGQCGTGAEDLHAGFPVLKSAVVRNTMSAYDTCFSGIAESAEDARLFIDTCTSVTRASMIPNVMMRTLYLEMTPYIQGEKTWEECYGRFLNALTLYANG